MKNCISDETFNLFFEDLLTAPETDRLLQHIAGCEACKKEFESWQMLKETLRDSSDIAVPEHFKANVMHAVKQQSILPRKQGFPMRRVMALAIVVLVGLLGIIQTFSSFNTRIIWVSLMEWGTSVLHQTLLFLGINPTVLYQAFGNIAVLFGRLFPVFAAATLLMILAFFLVLYRGKSLQAREQSHHQS